jgi:hypothetical protein
VLAIYRIIDIGSVTGAQFLIPVFGAGGFTIFAIMSIMITLSLVPVSLGDRSNPRATRGGQARPRAAPGASRRWPPSACIAVGVTNSAFRTLSPVYAEEIGMSVTDVVTFVSVSDHRRRADPVSAGLSVRPLGPPHGLLRPRSAGDAAALALATGRSSPLFNFVAGVHLRLLRHADVFAVGRACQRSCRPGEFVLVNAALMLFYSFGAMVGPFAALDDAWNCSARAASCSFQRMRSMRVLIAVILYRMQVRGPAPVRRSRPFHRAAEDVTHFRPAGAPQWQRQTDPLPGMSGRSA